MKINQVLESDMTETEQEQMHSKDENTTWFGIIREKGEMPLFQDYGRYAQILSDITSQDAHGAQDTRYPGMVSFVGQTGMLLCTRIAESLTYIFRRGKEHTHQIDCRSQQSIAREFCEANSWLSQKSKMYPHRETCTSMQTRSLSRLSHLSYTLTVKV
jgi:hypothetical protein